MKPFLDSREETPDPQKRIVQTADEYRSEEERRNLLVVRVCHEFIDISIRSAHGGSKNLSQTRARLQPKFKPMKGGALRAGAEWRGNAGKEPAEPAPSMKRKIWLRLSWNFIKKTQKT